MKTLTEYSVVKEGYAFGFDDAKTILSDMLLHEEDLEFGINEYLMKTLDHAKEMTEGQDETAEPKKVRVTVQVKLEELR